MDYLLFSSFHYTISGLLHGSVITCQKATGTPAKTGKGHCPLNGQNISAGGEAASPGSSSYTFKVK